ncbi:hypothetical protein [Streptomyces hainanensis]|uniref:Membrane lipoprotein n=1 Tax=Streptomyces hainanensis TaxID=402648 RepID=A0A4R4TIT0_9ACTN|nr:hypothetical protein [Streptomyces hainanensis]TDC74913.1 hypothetical protein E1283_14065 [Streptomyces hainanensis]
MRRRIRLSPLALLGLLVPLAACGEESAGRGELEARAASLETALELVYVTEVSGYELAPMSVAPAGTDGFQSTYVSSTGDGSTIHLLVDRGAVDPTTCDCEPDGDAVWYRPSTDRGPHAYVRAEDGHTVTVEAPADAVSRETLRTALDEAHVADDAELSATLPETPEGTPDAPVERGDLPPHGDGAPIDPEGAAG